MNEQNKYIWLLNPFYFVAGWHALLLGAIIWIFTAVLAWLSNTWFDGVLDAHYGASGSFLAHLGILFVDLLSLYVVFIPLSLIMSSSRVRVVDVAGTFALARFPLIFITFTGFSSLIPKFNQYILWVMGQQDMEPVAFSGFEIMQLAFLFLIVVLMIVWMVSLLFNAYRISANLKGPRAGLSFVFGILMAEVLSKIGIWGFQKLFPMLF